MSAVPFGPTGKVVYERTYSRTKPDGTRETWPETVERVALGNMKLVHAGDPYDWDSDTMNEYQKLKYYMLNFAILPAGRHLWATGAETRQHLFNCHVAGWGDTLADHYEFSFMRLMEGGGVGANYSTKYISKFGVPSQPVAVHITCDPNHPDYDELRPYLSDEFLPSTCWQYDDNEPYVKSYKPGDHADMLVEDSREGWADALKYLIRVTYNGSAWVPAADLVFDVSGVRQSGSKLMTFGGSASGPAPFAKMMHEVATVLNRAHKAEEFTPMDAMLIDHAIAECVVSGGNRRSARMSIVHWADPHIIEFINCKQDTDKHWTTNISVEIDDEFTKAISRPYRYEDNHQAHGIHAAVVKAMLKNGEPGYWNSSLSNMGEVEPVIATNPCVSADTWVTTTDGPRQVSDLIGVPHVTVLDGKPFATDGRGFYKTGHKIVYRVQFQEGFSIRCTENQEFYRPDGSRVEVQHLKPGERVQLSDQYGATWAGDGLYGDGYLLGSLIGDGTFYPEGTAAVAVWDNDGDEPVAEYLEAEVRRLGHRSDFTGWHGTGNGTQRRIKTAGLTRLAASYGITRGNKTVTDKIEKASPDFYRGFLRGLFDTDGHVEGSRQAGYSARLTQSDEAVLYRVQRMLMRLGIKSSVHTSHPEGRKSFAEYSSKASYRLIVSGRVFLERFMHEVGFLNETKQEKLEAAVDGYSRTPYKPRMTVRFESMTHEGTEDVYDCTVPGPYDYEGNGIRVRDCGEIPLAEWENCFDGDTEIVTAVGPQKLRNLQNRATAVWFGGEWHFAQGRSFGVQPVQRVTFAPARPSTGAGYQKTRAAYRRSVVVTPDHRWDTQRGLIDDLQPGDVVQSAGACVEKHDDEGIRHGVVYGDGSEHKPHRFRVRLYGAKQRYLHLFDHVTHPQKADVPEGWVDTSVPLKELPAKSMSPEYKAGFLEGWLAMDGTVRPNGSVVLSTISENAVRWLEDNAAALGWVVRGIAVHNGSTNYGARTAPLHLVTLAKGGEWIVESVEPMGEREVFCVTVPDAGRFTLGSGIETRNCNLGHVNLDWFAGKSWAELTEAHRLTTRFLMRATYGDVNDERQAKILAKNRRIGVGHLGVQGYWAKKGIKYSEIADEAPGFLQRLYSVVRQEARDYAFQLRIPEPVKVTTVAPTGSVAKLPGVSEGIHPIYSRWFERRVRFSARDEAQFTTVMEAMSKGFVVEDDQYDSTGMTKVVVYPTEDILVGQVRYLGFKDDVVQSADELSIKDMLKVQRVYQRHWADNAVSYTVNIPEGSVSMSELADILAEYLPDLKGTTIMVDASRPQAPYTRITREQYEVAVATVQEDGTDLECATGACPIR